MSHCRKGEVGEANERQGCMQIEVCSFSLVRVFLVIKSCPLSGTVKGDTFTNLDIKEKESYLLSSQWHILGWHSDSLQYKGVQYCYRGKEGMGEGRERKSELGGREVARCYRALKLSQRLWILF